MTKMPCAFFNLLCVLPAAAVPRARPVADGRCAPRGRRPVPHPQARAPRVAAAAPRKPWPSGGGSQPSEDLRCASGHGCRQPRASSELPLSLRI
jgi:hypothetical protein